MSELRGCELPGEDLITKGIADLSKGIRSIESLLVSIGRPRLEMLNMAIPQAHYEDFPEVLLYRLLALEDPDSAHARYNAYIRRLISYESSLELLNGRPPDKRGHVGS